jgi:hypothetical protein
MFRQFQRLIYSPARVFALLCASFLFALSSAAHAQDETRNFVRLVAPCADPVPWCRPVALHNETGSLQISEFGEGWWSAQWELLNNGENPQGIKMVRIRNRWTGAFVAATYDLNKPGSKEDKWGLALVKPGENLRSVQFYAGSRDAWQIRVAEGPMEDFDDSLVWYLVPVDGGKTAIINASIMGLRERAPILRGTVGLSSIPVATPGSGDRRGTIAVASNATVLNPDGSVNMKNVGAASWIIQPTGEFLLTEGTAKIRIIGGNGQGAVNIETGTPAAGDVGPGWLSAQWVAKRMAGIDRGDYRVFQNVWTGKYLGVANGQLTMVEPDPAAESGGAGAINYSWQVTGAPTKEGMNRQAIRNVRSGLYLTPPEKDRPLSLGTVAVSSWTLADIEAPVVQAAPEPEKMVRLRWMKNEAIHIENGPPTYGAIQPGWWSAQWIMEEQRGENRERLMSFRNRWQGGYLMVRNGEVIRADPANQNVRTPADLEEMWVVEGILDQGVTLRHARTGTYLNTGGSGQLTTRTARSNKEDDDDWSVEEVQ